MSGVATLDPRRTAVLALDLQRHMVHADSPVAQEKGFAREVRQRDLLARANEVLTTARRAGAHVAFVGVDLSDSDFRYPRRGLFCDVVAQEHDSGRTLRPGNWEHALHEDVVRLAHEPVFYKRHISAFAGSGLKNWLQENAIEDVVLLGVATTFVIAGTAWSAVSEGYSVIVLEDVSASLDAASHDEAIRALGLIADIWSRHTLAAALGQIPGDAQ